MCGTHAKRRRYHPRSGVRVTRRALISTFLRRGARWCRTVQRGREKSIRGIFDRITIETNDGVSYNMRTTMAAETRESKIFFFHILGSRWIFVVCQQTERECLRTLLACLLIMSIRRRAGQRGPRARKKDTSVFSVGSPSMAWLALGGGRSVEKRAIDVFFSYKNEYKNIFIFLLFQANILVHAQTGRLNIYEKIMARVSDLRFFASSREMNNKP